MVSDGICSLSQAGADPGNFQGRGYWKPGGPHLPKLPIPILKLLGFHPLYFEEAPFHYLFLLNKKKKYTGWRPSNPVETLCALQGPTYVQPDAIPIYLRSESLCLVVGPLCGGEELGGPAI